MKRYNPSEIEPKWQAKWEDGRYEAKDFSEKAKYVMLTEFPYPSGDGLHLGHTREYTLGDVIARYRRAKGENVLYPMGFDAFGLPTENYAIKNGITPQEATARNVETFTKQMKSLGYSIDWGRSFSTTDPDYYKWTQWLFLQFYKAGLAYQDEIAINWCPACKTGLANEEVIGGLHERCEKPVEKKTLKQWMMRITDYADRLIDGLRTVDYPSRIADQQVNWIGRSEGAEIEFKVDDRPLFRSEENPVREDKEFTKRDFVQVHVYDPKTKKYLMVKWKKQPWVSCVGGGVDGRDVVEAAREEVKEETGYVDLEFKRVVGEYRSEFYAANKDVNRDLSATAVLFELKSGKREEMSEEEKAIQEPMWMTRAEIESSEAEMPAYKETMWVFGEMDKGAREERKIKVFTTRADTIFGATFMVLAPEHPMVAELATDEQRKVVEKYVKTAGAKSEIERQENKEKTGVFTGAYVINPASGERMEIWVADYVLMGYGEGAIMAVPGHDERDFEFAMKFGLPVKQVVMSSGVDPKNPPKEGLEMVERSTVFAHLRDKKTGKFALLEWHETLEGVVTAVMGGVEEGETAEEAALKEFEEEVGITGMKLVKKCLWKTSAEYCASHKGVNRKSVGEWLLFEVDGVGERAQVDEKEERQHTLIWVDEGKVLETLTPDDQKLGWKLLMEDGVFAGVGEMVNSGKFNGKRSDVAAVEIVEWLEEKGVARRRTTYKLRDWIFSRQRYWGEPIPIIHCDRCGVVPVPDKDLPVVLPEVEDYEPTDDGHSPLASVKEWVEVKCPKCGDDAERETDTMPNWAGSSWYWLRYFDARNDEEFAAREKLDYWGEVDLYLGGMEHTTLHLLYSRFWHQFLHDQGLVPTAEPYAARRGQGIVLATDGTKMSKSKGNVVNPSTVIDDGYGADALRTAIVFLAPYDQTTPWSPEGVAGTYRFINRVWNLVQEYLEAEVVSEGAKDAEVRAVQNRVVKKVSEDLEGMHFNTAVAALMEGVNELFKLKLEGFSEVWQGVLEDLVRCMAPFAPHVAAELFEQLGGGSVEEAGWPTWDEKYLVASEAEVVVQVNGKLRGKVVVAAEDAKDEEKVKAMALEQENVQKFTEGKKVVKVIYVAKRHLVNVVVK